MPYNLKLKSANIEQPLKGNMTLGIDYNDLEVAAVEYEWTDTYFNARFLGHAPSLPIPAHPTAFIRKPIEEIMKLKAEHHRLPSDVFTDHQISIEVD